MHERSNQNPDADDSGKKVPRLEPMPEKPTLIDFFNLRFPPAAHLLQSARLARKNGMSEEIVLACLLHDAGQYLCRADHGYWGAQIFEPYVSERVTFAIKYHQALRFYPDPSVGYEYPESYLHDLRRRLRAAAARPGRLRVCARTTSGTWTRGW